MNLTALEAGTPIGAGASAFCAAIPRSTNVSKQKLSVFFWSKNGTLLASVMSQILLT